jgi:hypothetical protein
MSNNEQAAINQIIVKILIQAKHKFIKSQDFDIAANIRSVERYLMMEEGPEKDEYARKFTNSFNRYFTESE